MGQHTKLGLSSRAKIPHRQELRREGKNKAPHTRGEPREEHEASSDSVARQTQRCCFSNRKAHLVFEAEVTAARLQQQANDVRVTVFAGAHQGRGTLSVLRVYVGAAAQEQLHHGNAPVAHGEHERRLARLEKERERVRERVRITEN